MSEENKGYTIINAEHDITNQWNSQLRISDGENAVAYESFSNPILSEKQAHINEATRVAHYCTDQQ